MLLGILILMQTIHCQLVKDHRGGSVNKSSYDTLATSWQKITEEEVLTKQSSVTGKADPNSEAVAGSFIT